MRKKKFYVPRREGGRMTKNDGRGPVMAETLAHLIPARKKGTRLPLLGLGLFTITLATLLPVAVAFAQAVSFSPAANFAVGASPISVAIGDLNGDGNPDLAVANHGSTTVSILLGDGSGSFSAATSFAVGSNPGSVAIGDFNGDGKPDLAVANSASNNVSILLGDGAGSFSAATNFAAGSGPLSVAIGDLNGDGKPDLAVANHPSSNVSLLLGDGTGAFGPATSFPAGTNPGSVAIGDLNGDGKPDLAVANATSNDVSILINTNDTTPPTVTVPADMTVEATGSSGAAVNFASEVSATDLVDGPVAVSCTPASGSTFPLDVTTTVNCSAKDSHDNTATGSFKVTVVDTTPPKLTLPADIIANATGNSQAVVNYSASAYDLVDGFVPVSCTPVSGSSFSVGTTEVSCSATGAHNNTATGSFNVTVKYDWNGFFRPVDNLPTLNLAKAGSAIPVKFSLSGNQGLSIFGSPFPTSKAVVCGSTADVDTIEVTVTAGGSSLNYDAVADQYIYVWKTEKGWAGTCRTLTVKLMDGTVHQANFKFK